MRLERIMRLEGLPHLQVVVDLAIDGEDDLSVIAHQRLCARLCQCTLGVSDRLRSRREKRRTDADDGKPLVDHDGLLPDIAARPVRPAVPYFL